MRHEVAFFDTTDVSCQCGETCLAEGMYRMEVRCSHRIAVDEGFVGIPGPSHLHGPEIVTLIDEWHWPDTPVPPELSFVQGPQRDAANMYRQWEVTRLTKKIVKAAHASARKEEIRAWVGPTLGRVMHSLCKSQIRSSNCLIKEFTSSVVQRARESQLRGGDCCCHAAF
jgi:hypothetical protein